MSARLPRRMSVAALALCAFAAIAQSPSPPTPQAAPPTTVIHAGTLLATPGEAPLKARTVVVRGDRIVAVDDGFRPASQYGADARLVDLSDRFVMPGPIWTEADVPRALASVDQATGEDTLVVLSGSQPPGVAKDFPSILADHVGDRQARLIVDTSGPALFHLVEQPRSALHVLRMDGPEGEELAGRALPSREDTAEFAQDLVRKGVAKIIIVARGADGSVLATADGAWHSVNPPVKVVSKVGAGDSFVGAFTLALAGSEPVESCLKASRMVSGARLGWSIRAAHLVIWRIIPSWSSISCRSP